jgi:predicted MFS family arabinose efflux permease
VLVLLAFTDAAHDFTWLIAGVLITNLLAATQDIATDALAVDMLRFEERGFANGVQVAGYRVGMIIGGGALLLVFHHAGWTFTFLAAALLLALATLPIAMHHEPAPAGPERAQPVKATAVRPGAVPAALAALPDALPGGLIDTVRQPGMAAWLGVLAIYKAGESFATGMLRPMLVDLGLGMAQIGLLLGTAGFVAGLLGALAGGWAITRVGRHRALIAFALAQAAAVALYLVPAAGGASLALLYLVCGVEHFAGGMATAALFTVMMDRSRPEAAATDYTVQASVVVLATGTAAAVSGLSAEALGYPGHVALAALLCLAAAGCTWWHARSLAR